MNVLVNVNVPGIKNQLFRAHSPVGNHNQTISEFYLASLDTKPFKDIVSGLLVDISVP